MLHALHVRGTLLYASLAGLALGLAGGRLARPGGHAPELDGLREALAAHGLVVARGDAAWEGEVPSGIGDALGGHRALVLASKRPAGPRDLHRVEVRLAPGGSVLHVDSVVNLTETPHADEGSLAVSGRHAAYRARSYGQVSTVVVLDLAGEPTRLAGRADRWMASVTNVIETGDSRGIGRTHLRFDVPTSEVTLAWRDGALDIRWSGGTASWTPARGLAGPAAAALDASPLERHPKRPILWAVDTVRSYVGTAPIAWLEDQVFAARDAAKRARYRMEGDEEAAAAPDRLGPYVAVAAGGWPPAPTRSAFARKAPGESTWRPAAPEWIRTIAGAPPAFYETFVRPDVERPYAKVRVLAMDGRQLALGMEGGVEDPKPTTGAFGSGRIPRRPEVLDSLVGAFNGAFKTEHGEYGMMVEGRVLLPPVPGSATIATFADGRIGFGSWDADPSIPRGMVSFRQNLDPLLDGAVVNPRNRRIWGWARGGRSLEAMQTHRSGICELPGGHFAYLWSEDVNGPALGEAMRLAGCTYGMHLDMNEYHTSFYFLRVRDHRLRNYGEDYDVLPWDRRMIMGLNRYLKWAPKDFFYVTLRSPAPQTMADATWTASGLPQPEPAFLPALWSAERRGVRLLSMRTDRVDFVVRAGDVEPPTGTGEAAPSRIEDALRTKVLFAFGAGRAGATPSGIVVGRRVFWGLRDGEPALVRTESGEISIAAWPVAGAVDAVQGAWLSRAEDRPGAPDAAAVGLTADGRLVYADSGPESALADALSAAGATHAMRLARSGPVDPFLSFAGRDLREGYDQAAVFVLGRAPRPNVFRMDGTHDSLAQAAP